MPVEISQAKGDVLAIRWEDGHESMFPSVFLRRKCRCAVCVDEWTGKVRLNPDEIAEDVRPVEIDGVGRYGIRISWSDGHDTGIYTFKYLREICPCELCESHH